MTAIYKSQRELIDMSIKYAHAINDGLIGAGEIMPADGQEDSPMDSERADYATYRAWKARWYEIEGCRAERMQYIYICYLNRQDEIEMRTIIKAVILLAFAAVAIFWGGPIVPDAPAKQSGVVEMRLRDAGE